MEHTWSYVSLNIDGNENVQLQYCDAQVAYTDATINSYIDIISNESLNPLTSV